MDETGNSPGPFAPERTPVFVGAVTTVAGLSLLIAPGPAARFLGLRGQDNSLRLIGLSDLVLVPGLFAGRPRWPWMIGRAALNVAIAAYLESVQAESSEPERTRALAAVLGGLTAVDGITGLVLRSRETPA